MKKLFSILLVLAMVLALAPMTLASGEAVVDEVELIFIDEPIVELEEEIPEESMEDAPAEDGAISVSINASNFPDANFRAFVSTNLDTDKDGILSEKEINSVTVIDCSERNIASLNGIVFFTRLTKLQCGYNELTSLNMSALTSLRELYCSGNHLTSLDVSANAKLEKLYCANNSLTKLDLSKNTALTSLECCYNSLTKLDLSKNTALKTLDCYDNALTSLDLSRNTELESLQCNNNKLTSLDTGKNVNLSFLACPDNQITSLDLSSNTKLTTLYCGDNALTGLELSANPKLEAIQCQNNRIGKLDLTGKERLRYLRCEGNPLGYVAIGSSSLLKEAMSSGESYSYDGVAWNYTPVSSGWHEVRVGPGKLVRASAYISRDADDIIFMTEPQVITSAAVTGLDEPAVGKTGDTSVSVPGGAHYTLDHVVWYDATADAGKVLTGSWTFQSDHVYNCLVQLKADSGYVFERGFAAAINGEEPYNSGLLGTGDASQTAWLEYRKALVSPTYYSIDFKTDYGTAPETQLIAQNLPDEQQVVKKPSDPVDPTGKHVFKYWATRTYQGISILTGKESYRYKEYRFDSTVSSSMTLYAVWETVQTADPTLTFAADAKSVKASGDFSGLYARVALVLDNNGVSGLYITQATINDDGTILIPEFKVPGLKVKGVNVALVPTLADVQSTTPNAKATATKML